MPAMYFFRILLCCLALLFCVAAAPEKNDSTKAAASPSSSPKQSSDCGVLVVYNKSVPAGEELACAYGAFRGLPKECLAGFSMPVEETVSMELYLSQVAEPVKRLLEERPCHARVILCCYGVPLFVRDGSRIRSLDRMLSLLFRASSPGGGLVENPYWRRVIEYKSDLPLLVSRLDGPSPVLARAMLEGWRTVERYGRWRRHILDLGAEDLKAIGEAGFFVLKSSDPGAFPLEEIACLQSGCQALEVLARNRGGRLLSDGAMVILADDGRERFHFRSFRSLGESSASAASMLGAGFFLGVQAPRFKDYEDFFDVGHFFERYISGETFVEAAHGALANLGGSFLILGDPMSRPFGDEEMDRMKAFYESGQVEGSEPEALRRHGENKLWWLLRGILEDWGCGRTESAIVKARGAALMRRDFPPYHEALASFLFQTGDYASLREALAAFPEKAAPYYKEYVMVMKGKLPSAAPGK